MGTIYTAAKMWHYPEQLEALKNGTIAAPVHIRLKPTNVCNHSCYFCAYRDDGMALGEDMNLKDRIDPQKMVEIVEDIIAMGVEAVTFSGGGEPLLYPTIVETVTRLAEGGVSVAALTNASQLKGARADVFARFGAWLRVSIDGWDGPSYAKYRSVGEDEFAKVTDNLKAFADRGSDCALGASIIVDKSNAGHIAELTETLKDAGVAHVKMSACVVSNNGAENNAYHAPFKEVVEAQILQAEKLVEDGFEVINHYHELDDRFDKDYQSCPFMQFLTVIAADGNVYSCQDKAYTESGKLGSLQEQGFRDMWFSDSTRERMRNLDPSVSCSHHCVAENKNRMLIEYLNSASAHRPFV